MASELSRINRHPYFLHTQQAIQARREWADANPELSAAWDEALEQDEGWRIQARERARVEREEADLPNALRAAGVPLRCVEVLADTHQTPALEAVRDFLGGMETFCLLLGAAGAGKSVAASYAVREALRGSNWTDTSFRHRHTQPARFMRAADMARMSAYGAEAEREFEGMCNSRLFVLDDMGTERTSDTWQALLDELIDRRYGDKLQTILTTNLDMKLFKVRYGDRIADRIRHDGVVVGSGADSLRTPRRP